MQLKLNEKIIRKELGKKTPQFHSGSVKLDLHPLFQALLKILIKNLILPLSTNKNRIVTSFFFGFKNKPNPFYGLGSDHHNMLKL